MKAKILGLLAETAIHSGAGSSSGVIDLPVAREAATDYPVLVGSSLKGALRDAAEDAATIDKEKVKEYFGESDRAGAALVSDARLLLLPVRSLRGAYKWVTCPYLLERYKRDSHRAGQNPDLPLPRLKPEKWQAIVDAGPGQMFLEEHEFTASVNKEAMDKLAKAIEPLVLHEPVRERLGRQMAVLHDDDFAWFARYGLSVQARNKLEKESKQSSNLWYEEALPPDTLMYALLLSHSDGGLDWINEVFGSPYLQAGGNETIGQGWFAVSTLPLGAGEKGEGA